MVKPEDVTILSDEELAEVTSLEEKIDKLIIEKRGHAGLQMANNRNTAVIIRRYTAAGWSVSTQAIAKVLQVTFTHPDLAT